MLLQMRTQPFTAIIKVTLRAHFVKPDFTCSYFKLVLVIGTCFLTFHISERIVLVTTLCLANNPTSGSVGARKGRSVTQQSSSWLRLLTWTMVKYMSLVQLCCFLGF